MLNSIYPIPGRFGRLLLIFLRRKIQKRLRVDIFYNKSTGKQPSEPSGLLFLIRGQSPDVMQTFLSAIPFYHSQTPLLPHPLTGDYS